MSDQSGSADRQTGNRVDHSQIAVTGDFEGRNQVVGAGQNIEIIPIRTHRRILGVAAGSPIHAGLGEERYRSLRADLKAAHRSASSIPGVEKVSIGRYDVPTGSGLIGRNVLADRRQFEILAE